MANPNNNAFSVDIFMQRYAEFQEYYAAIYHIHHFEGHSTVIPNPSENIDEHVVHLLSYDTNIGHYAHWLLTHQVRESEAANWGNFGFTPEMAVDRINRLTQMLPPHSVVNAWDEDWIQIVLHFWERVQDALGHLGDVNHPDNHLVGWCRANHFRDNTTSIPMDWTIAKLLASFAKDAYRDFLGGYNEEWFEKTDHGTHGEHMAEKYNHEFGYDADTEHHGIICLGEYDDHKYAGRFKSFRGKGIFVVLLLRYHYVWEYGVDGSLHSHEETELFIVFRGTDNVGGMITDLKSLPVYFPDGKKAQVHCGFKRVYDKAHKHILEIMNDPTKRRGHPAPSKIYITGHSLGGALGTLCTFNLRSLQAQDKTDLYAKDNHVPQDWFESDIHLYTFGAPSVGNKGFHDSMKALVANKVGSGFQVHFRTKYDPVPDSPTFLHYKKMKKNVRYYAHFPYRFLQGPEQADHADVNLLWNFVESFHKKRNHNLGLMDWVPRYSLKRKAAQWIWLRVIMCVGIPLALLTATFGFMGYIYVCVCTGDVSGLMHIHEKMRRVKVKVERIVVAAVKAHSMENYETVLHNHVWYEHNADTKDQTGLYRNPLRGLAYVQEDEQDETGTGIFDFEGHEIPAPTFIEDENGPTLLEQEEELLEKSNSSEANKHSSIMSAFDTDKTPEMPPVTELEAFAKENTAEAGPGVVDIMLAQVFGGLLEDDDDDDEDEDDE